MKRRKRGPSAQLEAFPLAEIVPGIMPRAVSTAREQAEPGPLFAPTTGPDRQTDLEGRRCPTCDTPYLRITSPMVGLLAERPACGCAGDELLDDEREPTEEA